MISIRQRILMLSVFSTMLLAGCADTTPSVPIDNAAIDKLPGDRLIVPGQRVGPIYLGESIDDVIAAIGSPDSTGSRTVQRGQSMDDYQWDTWGRYGLETNYAAEDARAQISAIWVWSPKWRTAEGVGIDTPFKDAINLIPDQADPPFQTVCVPALGAYPAQCVAEDRDGMLIHSKTRDDSLYELSIYLPSDDDSPVGNHSLEN